MERSLRRESMGERNNPTPLLKVVGFHVEGVSNSPAQASHLLQEQGSSGMSDTPNPVIIPPSFQVCSAPGGRGQPCLQPDSSNSPCCMHPQHVCQADAQHLSQSHRCCFHRTGSYFHPHGLSQDMLSPTARAAAVSAVAGASGHSGGLQSTQSLPPLQRGVQVLLNAVCWMLETHSQHLVYSAFI